MVTRICFFFCKLTMALSSMVSVIWLHIWLGSVIVSSVSAGSSERKKVATVKYILENYLYFTNWQKQIDSSDYLNDEYYR